MDPRLLDYYNEELIYMREMAREFSRLHPKIARRLGMGGIEVADPYVERLIEAFCFLSARTRIKLDAQFPVFTQRLLEVIYPNYVAPTPAMSVAQLHLSKKEGDFSKGQSVPRGTALRTPIAYGEKTPCEFRTTQAIRLWPLRIDDARLTSVPADIPDLARYVAPHVELRGALRIRLTTDPGLTFARLSGLDELPVYLPGNEHVASHLFELIHGSAVATLVGGLGGAANKHVVLAENSVVPVGFAPHEGALPLPWNAFQGHNLLHEYFVCPRRFYFFSIKGLAPALSRIDSREVEIVVLLAGTPERLAAHVDAGQFALFCTPVVNLFPKRTDRIELHPGRHEFHVVPDRSQPLDYEIHSIEAVTGQQNETSESFDFRPLFSTLNHDEGNYGRYFSARRQARLISDQARKYGTRTSYVGSEVFLSLVDQHDAPYSGALRYLSVQALVTNRDLPSLIQPSGASDLAAPDSLPIAGASFLFAPSVPRPPFAEREIAWRLVRQLGFNYLPLDELDGRQGGQGLRDMLRLFISTDDAVSLRQMQSVIGCDTTPVTRRLPGHGPLIYGRGIHCRLTVDETGFSGVSPFLFGMVLEQYLARHVSTNTFCETELVSTQRGPIHAWPARFGGRGVV
ncbi:MAG: type VI secretion system baseplate subunit TssF [Rhodocyclaceae bacterium]